MLNCGERVLGFRCVPEDGLNKTRTRGFAVCSLVATCLVQGTIADPPRRFDDGIVDRIVDRTAARSQQRIGDPTSANLEAVAGRIVSDRCNLLVVGDSIATHFALGERGSWVTGIWRAWKPDRWRGRFIPGERHGEAVNGTAILNGGRSPGFDARCEPLVPNGAVNPGESIDYFEAGWWSLLGHPHVTTGDLEDRLLQSVDLLGAFDARDYWSRYRSDPDWAVGDLRATALLVGEPGGLERFALRARTSDGAWTPTELVDVSDALPVAQTDLLAVPFEFGNDDLGPDGRGSVGFEIRTDPGFVEEAGRTFFMLGATIERTDVAEGLLLGSNSIGGDTTRSHLPEGEVIATNGSPLLRFYTDDYLARFIELSGWDTFLVTLGTNDLNAMQRDPEVVVQDVARVVDRYRAAAAVARTRRPDLREPRFLVVSPATAGDQAFEPRFEALDAGLMSLAGDDVGVIRLQRLLRDAIGSYEDHADQLLVDVTHPGDAGAMLKAELVWRELEAAVGRTSEADGPLWRIPEEVADPATLSSRIGPDDVVLVGPGTYPGGLRIEAPGVAIRSSHGPESTVLDGGGVDRCLTIASVGGAGVEVRDLALVHGRAVTGGGLLVESGSAHLRNARIADCIADDSGGAIAMLAGDLRIESSAITASSAGGRGGAVSIEGGSAVLAGVVVEDGVAGTEGGGIWSSVESMLVVEDGTFLGNRAFDGGAISAAGSTSLVDVDFVGNAASGDGGAVLANGPLDAIGIVFQSNRATGSGGAIRLAQVGDSTIVQARFEDNIASDRGGALSGTSGGRTFVIGSELLLSGAGVAGGVIHADCHDFDVESTSVEGTSAPTCELAEIVCGELRLSGVVLCPDTGEACGTVVDGGGNEEPPACDGICEGDLNFDGDVDGGDLGLLFAAWGDCPPASFCRADLDRNGRVDGTDLGLMLSLLGGGGDC